ncbi:MAG: hypothetical protein OHK0015_29200 [Chloroflexi bacterium OHK40]
MDRQHLPWPNQANSDPAWRELFCTCNWCRAERWVVRADPRSPELWLICENTSDSPWSIAASEPVCPRCGEPLAAHIEGIGDPEGVTSNPFITYIRTLRRAA